MGMLILILFLITISAGALFYVLALFLQGWYYTEPAPGTIWRAPTAGAVVGLFYFFWCLLIYNSGARPGAIPYDTLMRYSSEVRLLKEPVDTITAYYGNTKKVYRYRGSDDYKSGLEPWKAEGITKLEIKVGAETLTFARGPADRFGSRTYVNDQGWTMTDNPGSLGLPVRNQAGRGFANWMINIVHGLVWFLCFWLLVRFGWPEALLLSAVLWLVMTLGVLPMIFTQVAARAPQPTANQAQG